MASRAPDKIQRGGIIKRFKKPETGRITDSKKRVSDVNIAIRSKQRITTKKPVSTLQLSAQKRAVTLRAKRAVAKATTLQRQQAVAALRPTIPVATTRKQRNSQLRNANITLLSTGIRAKARTAAAKAILITRANLLKTSKAKETAQSFSLTSRLENLNTQHRVVQVRSTQADTADTLKTAGSMHGTSDNLLARSKTKIDDAVSKRDISVQDNVTQKNSQTATENTITNARLPDRLKERDKIQNNIDDAKKAGSDASSSAETARVKGDLLPKIIEKRVEDRNRPISVNLEVVKLNKKASEDSGAVAAEQDSKRQSINEAKDKQKNTRDEYDSNRNNAAADIVKYTGGVSAAAKRKNENETSLVTLQKNNNEKVTTMKSDAYGKVSDLTKKLADATDAIGPRTKEKADAMKAKKDKEEETTSNAKAIEGKGNEIDTAKRHDTDAKDDYDNQIKDVSETQRKLDTLNFIEDLTKTSRDIALDDMNNNTAIRNPFDEIYAERRADITNKDIPDQRSIKTSAQKGISEANTGIPTANKSKEANNTELNPMGPLRRDRIAEDIKLRDRSTEATKANGAAQKSKEAVVADLNTKQNALQSKRQYIDDLDNLVSTRNLQKKRGVNVVIDGSLTVLVTSKQHSASTAGIISGKKHAESAAAFTKSNDHLTGVNNTLKNTGADQERLGGIKDDMIKSIPRENANADTLHTKRKDIPDNISRAKAEADMAARKAKENRIGIEGAGAELDMANDAFHYFNDPLVPTYAKIAKNTQLTNAAGSNAAKHRDALIGAGDSASKARNSQQNADAGRKQSAQDITSHTAAYNASVKRKPDSETALANIQKKHQSDMDAMKANANDTVTKHKGDLDGAMAMARVLGPLPEATTKKRSDKYTEATTQGVATASKLDEVNNARGNEAKAKKVSDDAAADLADKQDKITAFINSEPGLKSDRETARSTAEAAKPVRDPADVTNKKRQETLQNTEIPAATSVRNKAKGDSDAAADSLSGKGGLNEKRTAGENDLDSIKNTRSELELNSSSLRRRRDIEGENLKKVKESRDGVDSKIIDGNKSIQKISNHIDEINNRIAAKKEAGQSAAPPQSMANIMSKQTTSGNTMTTNGKKHAMSEGAFNASNQHTGRLKDSIKDLERTGADFFKKRDEVEGILSAENKPKVDIDRTVKQIDGLKKNADDASKSANDAIRAQQDVKARPGGIDNIENYRGLISGSIGAKQANIAKNKKGADNAGATAADANSLRNISATNAEKIKGELGNHDAKRRTENENTSRHQAEANAARARKVKNDTDLDNVKKVHNDTIDKMKADSDSAATKHKKGLDDATRAASAQYDASTGAAGKRKKSEEDGEANKTDISKKREDVDKARDNELAAKQKHDTDAAAAAQHKKDLDVANQQEAPLKKDRDDARDAANGALPERSLNDIAKHKRKNDIDNEVDRVKKNKSDTEADVAMAKDGAARAKAKKEGLSDSEDTKPLGNNDDDLNHKKKKEQDNHDELETESKKNKKQIEDGEIKIALRQNMVGMIAGLIMNMLNKNFDLLPLPSPPYITGQFEYPLSTASGSLAPMTSGPALAGLVSDTSGNTDILTALTDISGTEDFAELGPSGVADYTVHYNRGLTAGTQDGTRDATSDATEAYSNKKDITMRALQEKIGMLSVAKQSAIDKEVTRQTQEAYCKKVEEEGKAKKLDIYTVFSECTKYFEQTIPKASQPILEKPRPSVSEDPGAQAGGYTEDLSGVMQFGGELTDSGPTPTEDSDAAYMAGYQAGYKKAYIQKYSLTIAIKITQQATLEKDLTASAARVEYGEAYGEAVEQLITASMPITEASAKAPKNATGAVSEIKSNKPETLFTEAAAKNSINATGPVTEAAAKNSINATGPVTEAEANSTNASGATEGGGFLKLAKRKYQRGKTLTQHGHLLNKIKDKTSVA